MSAVPSSIKLSVSVNDCSICLSALAPGEPRLTLSCNHEFHLQCFALNVKAQNNQCPLCRATIKTSLSRLLTGPSSSVLNPNQSSRAPLNAANTRQSNHSASSTNAVSRRKAPVNQDYIRVVPILNDRAQQTTTSSTSEPLPLITATTTMEFGGQLSHRASNIHGIVTLTAPSLIRSSSSNRVAIDLVCVVDQSASMADVKLTLLKQTLVYIVGQLNEFDRLAIITFDTQAFDKSHGLKFMNGQNQRTLKGIINNSIDAGGSTFIGSGLEKGIELFAIRSSKNPVSALLLLTDGQDNREHDYSPLMQRLPEDVVCHTFAYGTDPSACLLAQIAEQGNDGSFTHIDQQQAVGPAFATVLGGLLSCIAQEIRVNLEFEDRYRITHVHSKYQHEPDHLPSRNITFILKDLNADEQRNLVFQLFVPRVNEQQSEESQEAITQNQIIGHVSITYNEPGSDRRVNTPSVPFQLIRGSNLSPDLLQINHIVDRQRNRIETAAVLKQAMSESNYSQSLILLKAQVEKINGSVSAQDPFCQQLVKDLQCRYETELNYRSSNQNAMMQHASERGTYSSTYVTSAQIYQSPIQLLHIDQFRNKKS